jgi:hypothetical protein
LTPLELRARCRERAVQRFGDLLAPELDQLLPGCPHALAHLVDFPAPRVFELLLQFLHSPTLCPDGFV